MRLGDHGRQQPLGHVAVQQAVAVLAEGGRVPHRRVHRQTDEPAEQQGCSRSVPSAAARTAPSRTLAAARPAAASRAQCQAGRRGHSRSNSGDSTSSASSTTARISRSGWSTGSRALQRTQPNNDPVCSSDPRIAPLRRLRRTNHVTRAPGQSFQQPARASQLHPKPPIRWPPRTTPAREPKLHHTRGRYTPKSTNRPRDRGNLNLTRSATDRPRRRWC